MKKELKPDRRNLETLLEERLAKIAFSLDKSDEGIDLARVTEQLLRLHLGELNFSFAEENLKTLKGFMVFDKEYRQIVSASDLETEERIKLYLTMVSHVVLGHLGYGEPGQVRYQYRNPEGLPNDDRLEEQSAEKWMKTLLYSRLKSRCGQNNPMIHVLARIFPEF